MRRRVCGGAGGFFADDSDRYMLGAVVVVVVKNHVLVVGVRGPATPGRTQQQVVRGGHVLVFDLDHHILA